MASDPLPEPGVFYRWWFVDERTGKPRRTSWKMTPETVAAMHPHCTHADLSTRETRSYIGSAGDLGTGR